MADKHSARDVSPSSPFPLTAALLSDEIATIGDHTTILLVEDDLDILEIASLLLSSLGYTVVGAHGSPDALQKFNSYQGPIDILLTDIIMPEMNGPKLAESLCDIDPGLKVVFMSAYSGQALPGNRAQHFIQKPFTRDILARKLREVTSFKTPCHSTTQ